MSEIPVCRPPDRNPRRSALAAPPGSVDCHTHVFDSRFPLSPQRGYTPPDSTLADMLHMHAQLGIERVVLTQPSAYGIDNSAILDAMAQIPEQARAVISVDMTITDDQLVALDGEGVRGLRVNLDNKGGIAVALSDVPILAERVRDLGWHVEFLFAGSDLPELAPLLRSLTTPVSVAHFAYMPADAGVAYPPFRLLVDLVREDGTWVKLSAPNRLGVGDLGPWDEVVPMAHALIEANPERMLWASDWPHPNKFGDQPNDADLFVQLGRWAPDEYKRRRILVDNPAALYRF